MSSAPLPLVFEFSTINPLSLQQVDSVNDKAARKEAGSIVVYESGTFTYFSLLLISFSSSALLVLSLYLQSLFAPSTLKLIETHGGLEYHDYYVRSSWTYVYPNFVSMSFIIFACYGSLFSEGDEALRKKSVYCFWVFYLGLCSASIYLWTHTMQVAGVSFIQCNPDYFVVGSIIYAIVLYICPLVIPVVILYYMTWKTSQKHFRWKGFLIKFFLVIFPLVANYLYWLVLVVSPNFALLYPSFSALQQFLFRILILPLFNQIFSFLTKTSIKRLHDLRNDKIHDLRNDIWMLAPYTIVSSLFSKFFSTATKSYGSATAMVFLAAFSDLFRRYTILWQNKIVDIYILRMKRDAAEAKVRNDLHHQRIGRMLLLDILIETSCCILIPAIQFLFQKRSFDFRIDYDYTGYFDVNIFIYSSVLGFILQILTDFICLSVVFGKNNALNLNHIFKHWTQEDHNDVKSQNIRQFMFEKIPLFTAILYFGNTMLINGFNISPYQSSSDACSFINNCIPYPCGNAYCFPQGFNLTSSQVINTSALNSVTDFQLGPNFEKICLLLLAGNASAVLEWPLFKLQ